MARILIVEDDRNTLSGLVEILQEEGYEVVGLDNAPAALRTLERERFDILLTDLKMPEIDGFQLYEKSLAIAPDMKTIIMTAYSSVKDAVEAMKRGVYEYLTKPLNLDELFVTLRKVPTADKLSRHLSKKMEEISDRLQKATIEVTDLKGQLMTQRVSLSDRLAELSLEKRKEKALAETRP